MRVHPRRKKTDEELGRRIARLERLPSAPVDGSDGDDRLARRRGRRRAGAVDSSKTRSICELDPGWIQAQSTVGPGSAHWT